MRLFSREVGADDAEAFPLAATPAAAARVAADDGFSLRLLERPSEPKPESAERSAGRTADCGLEKSECRRERGAGRGEGPTERDGNSVEPPRSRSKMPSSTIWASSSWLPLPAPGGGESMSSSSDSASSISERSKSPASDMSDEGPQRGEPNVAAADASELTLMPHSREPSKPDAGGETAAGLQHSVSQYSSSRDR